MWVRLPLPLHSMERRKVGVLIRLENGDVGNSDVEVRSPYAPPNYTKEVVCLSYLGYS